MSSFGEDFRQRGLSSVEQIADRPELLSDDNLEFLSPLQRRKLRAAAFEAAAFNLNGEIGNMDAANAFVPQDGWEAVEQFEVRGVSLDGGVATGIKPVNGAQFYADIETSSSFSSVPSSNVLTVNGRAVARRGMRGSIYFKAPDDPEDAIQAVI